MNGGFLKPLLIIYNKKKGKVVKRKAKPRKVRKVICKEESGVSCVGYQLKDRGDQDHDLIFKMNNKRGRKKETDKRDWK